MKEKILTEEEINEILSNITNKLSSEKMKSKNSEERIITAQNDQTKNVLEE